MNEERQTILLVEDEEAHVYFIRKAFQKAASRFALHSVSSLEEARAWLKDNTPVITITDLNLPDGKGIELVENERHEKKAIIVMTGLGDETEAVRALKAGALDYVVKSDYSFNEMPHLVDRALREFSQIQENRRVSDEIRKLSHAVEQSFSALLITNLQGTIEYANPRFTEIAGYTAEEIIGKNPRILSAHDPAAAVDYKNMWQTLKAGETWRGLFHNKRKDGTLYWDQTTITPIRNEKGEITHYVAAKEDITEQRKAKEDLAQMEAQLRRSQKMQTIGTLAGGIAHDFNNILTPIFGFAHMALQGVASDSPVHSDIEHIIKAAERARDLVRQILVFGRQGENTERSPIQLSPVVKEAAQMMRAMLPSTIEIKTKIAANLSMIEGDPTQIHQILINLCTNASHAVNPVKGLIEVRVQNETLDEEFCHRFSQNLKPGKYVSICVKDNGQGMPPEVLERIFEPFFTTKPVGKGTGLGLSVVHGIVTSHKGEIFVDSKVGEGSTFRIYFPAISASQQETPQEQETIMGHGEQILLVDDEPENVKMATKALEYLGYQVTPCEQSPKALETFIQNPQKFDMLITDQTMPAMSGLELARNLLQVRSGFPIILLSGYLEADIPQEIKEVGIAAFLTKPVVLSELSIAIHKALHPETLNTGEHSENGSSH
jgi:PAS domain S-box-containing protein